MGDEVTAECLYIMENYASKSLSHGLCNQIREVLPQLVAKDSQFQHHLALVVSNL